MYIVFCTLRITVKLAMLVELLYFIFESLTQLFEETSLNEHMHQQTFNNY